MHLYLTGYRGTGKTSLARLLARRLHRSWVDTDDLVEQAAGVSIREIFATQGEASFRDLETLALQGVSQRPPHVIALGGGAILRDQNRSVIGNSGRCVWLKASPENLYKRLSKDASTRERRPSLTSLTPLEEIRKLLIDREPSYRIVANYSIDTDGMTLDEIADEIERWWKETLEC